MGANHSVPAGYFLFMEEYLPLVEKYELSHYTKLITGRELRAGAPSKPYGHFCNENYLKSLFFREGVARVHYYWKWGIKGVSRVFLKIGQNEKKLERAILFLLTPEVEKKRILEKSRILDNRFKENGGEDMSLFELKTLADFKEVEKSTTRTPSLEDKLLLWEMFLTFFGKELREEGPDKFQKRLVLTRFFRDDASLAREAKKSNITFSKKEEVMLKTISKTLSEFRSLEFSPRQRVSNFPKKIRDLLLEVSPFRLTDDTIFGKYKSLLSYIESSRLKKKIKKK